MSDRGDRSGGGRGMLRVTALMSSVMDLHVRIALQEADKEKRRLVGGGVMLGMGLTLMTLALVAAELVLLLWIRDAFSLSWLQAAAAGFSGSSAGSSPGHR